MVSVNVNLNSLIAGRQLIKNQNDVNTLLQRLSSGYRINSAKDDAASFAVATNMETDISSLNIVLDNIEQSSDLLSTAEGSLSKIQDMLQRIRDLSLEALNGTYSQEEKNMMQKEAESLLEEISRIRDNTEYNGMKILGDVVEENMYNSSPLAASMTYSAPAYLSSSSEPESLTSLAPKMLSSAPKLSSAPLLAGASPTISGAFDLLASETNKKVTIDGVEYTFSNRNAETKSVSYSKDSDGVLTFYCNYVKIEGDKSKTHNLFIQGNYNYVYGGNYDDTMKVTGKNNYLYGGAGNDTMEGVGDSSVSGYNHLYGEDGNDILSGGYTTYMYGGNGNDTLTGTLYNPVLQGDAGDDIINIKGTQGGYSYRASGGDGNDIFNIYTTSGFTINGDGDDDTFNVYSTLHATTTINGGTGTNNVVVQPGGSVGSATLVNVEGGNAFEVAFAKNETKNLTIDGKNYSVTNGATAQTLIYKIDSGTINFSTSSNTTITITGDENVSHNVKLSSNAMTFYGGKYADTVNVCGGNCNVYALGGNDTIISSGGSCKLDGGDGDDSITVASSNNIVNGGNGADTIYANGGTSIINGDAGNDTIYVKSSLNSIMGGDGDDNVILQGTYQGLSIDGGSGTNTISGISGQELISGFGSSDNATAVGLSSGEEKTVTINGKTYKVKNNQTVENQLLYSYDAINDEITFSGNRLNITADSSGQNNVRLKGYATTYYGSNNGDTIKTNLNGGGIYSGLGNDTITIENGGGSCTITDAGGDNTFNLNYLTTLNTGNGNNIINVNSKNSTINGGTGVDTYYINNAATITDKGGNNVYYINTNSANITGGNGDDTFYITGNNNSVSGSSGDDYFVIDGTGGFIDGGTGTNYYVDNSGGTAEILNAVPDPAGGSLSFTHVNETKSFTIDGKTYTVTNQNAEGTSPSTNILNYYYNQNTQTVTLVGSDFTIESPTDTPNIVNLRGDNNTIYGGNYNDNIKIESGENNIIYGLSGNDTITMESKNNSINAGDGNDNIILNASTSKDIISGSGVNTVTLNGDNYTNLKLQDGQVSVSGTSNSSKIALGSYNNTVFLNGSNNTVTGSGGNNNVTLVGNNSSVTLGNGNNSIKVQGDDAEITTGNGNSSVLIRGNNGDITAGNNLSSIDITGSGTEISAGNNLKTLSINGSSSNIELLDGDTNVSVTGDGNTFTMGDGNNDINIKGNNNNLTFGDGTKDMSLEGDTNTIVLPGQTTASIIGNSNNITTGDEADSITFNGSSNTIDTNGGEDTVSFKGNDNEVYGGADNDIITIKSGERNLVDGEGGNKNYVYDTGKDSDIRNAIRLKIEPFKLETQVDVGSDDDSMITTEISFSTKGLAIDFSSEASINDNLNDIDDLIDTINSQLASIGSTQNILASVSNRNYIKMANLQSSLSTIRDVDVAKATAELAKSQILRDISASLLSQTNSNANLSLKLLHGINSNNFNV